MKLNRKDVATIPNAITAARLVASPFVAKKLRESPKSWPVAALFAFSDNFDGILARLGDNNPQLAALGFRRSEVGRKLDPLTDKLFTSEILVAGMLNKTIPKWLGGLSLTQKAVISGMTIYHESQGIELAVTQLGRHSEMATNIGFGTLLIAGGLEAGKSRERLYAAGITIAAVGIAAAAYAAYDYARHGQANRELSNTERALA